MPKPKKITYSGDSKIIKAIVNIGNWLLDNQYELPVASDEELGGIKVGNNLSIDENGVLSADAASIEELNDIGDVNISNVSVGQILKYGGTSVGWQNEDEYEYELPKASTNTLGGIKVGSNLSIDNDGTLNATGGSSVSALDDLSDVDITTPTVGQILKYGGTSTGWVNDDESGGLTPVELTYSQYQALTSEQKNDPTKEYFVTDYPGIVQNVMNISKTFSNYTLSPGQKIEDSIFIDHSDIQAYGKTVLNQGVILFGTESVSGDPFPCEVQTYVDDYRYTNRVQIRFAIRNTSSSYIATGVQGYFSYVLI